MGLRKVYYTVLCCAAWSALGRRAIVTTLLLNVLFPLILSEKIKSSELHRWARQIAETHTQRHTHTHTHPQTIPESGGGGFPHGPTADMGGPRWSVYPCRRKRKHKAPWETEPSERSRTTGGCHSEERQRLTPSTQHKPPWLPKPHISQSEAEIAINKQ